MAAHVPSATPNADAIASALPLSQIAKQPYDRERLMEEVRHYMAKSVKDVLGVGERLYVLKAMEPHGTFVEIVTNQLGISSSAASKFMRVARTLHEGERRRLVSLAKEKLFTLMALDGSSLDLLAAGREIAGFDLVKLHGMTVKGVREAVKAMKDELNRPLPNRAPSHVLERTGGGTGNSPTSANLTSDLQPGDRVMHTGNGDFGTVKQIYPDGSASVLWDGWEAAGAGVSLGIPRDGMELVSHAEPPTSAVEDSQCDDYGRSLDEPVIGERPANSPTSANFPPSPADAHGFPSAARDLRSTMTDRLYELSTSVRHARTLLSMLRHRCEGMRRGEDLSEDSLSEIEDMVEVTLETLPHHYDDLLDPLEADLHKMEAIAERRDLQADARAAAEARVRELVAGLGAPEPARPAAR